MRAVLLIACWCVLASGAAAAQKGAGEARIDLYIGCMDS